MTEINLDNGTRVALDSAWNTEAAIANMDRWLMVCRREGWDKGPVNLALLARLFGASWYFTRLVFYRGQELERYFGEPSENDFTLQSIQERMQVSGVVHDLEQGLELIRNNKNGIMLGIFLAQLDGRINQQLVEQALTNLAVATLQTLLTLLTGHGRGRVIPFAILAMGRMAGREMNYGSDLDLIFLYGNTPGVDIAGLTRNIQQMLRYIAMPSPGGVLYEIDMRLRPHGTSGTLISPASYFVEYHHQQREIWERQMMTRCLPVIDPEGLAAQSLEQITAVIYGGYDRDILRNEVVNMRGRVEKELGTPKGKFEIKRGFGGIMDIDFITHYLQLLHGGRYPVLRTTSTRDALAQLKNLRILPDDEANELLKGYDFLKRVEGVLRVADMKNINSFPQDPAVVGVLARAMGHYDTDRVVAGKKFIEEYLKNTQQIRLYFNQLTGQTG